MEGLLAPPEPHAQTSDAELRDRRIAAVRELIEALPEGREKEIVVLRYQSGESEAAIALRMGMSRPAVSSVLSRFRRRIRIDLLVTLSEIEEEVRNGG